MKHDAQWAIIKIPKIRTLVIIPARGTVSAAVTAEAAVIPTRGYTIE
jgi:hypothetical protein